MTYYAIAYVPAYARSAAESAVAPYLLGPGVNWAIPITNDGTTITHYGCCAPILSDSQLIADLPMLAASIPGSEFHIVSADEYRFQRDWAGWLEARALSVFRKS